MEFTGENEITVSFPAKTKDFFLDFAAVDRPAGVPDGECIRYELSGTAEFRPESGSGTRHKLRLGINDKRGWQATRSAFAFNPPIRSDSPTVLDGNFFPLPDCPGLHAVLRVEQITGKPVAGKVIFRNLSLRAVRLATHSAVPALTVHAALADAGNKLYLIVINRSPDTAIPARLDIRGSVPEHTAGWEIFQPDVGRITDFPIREFMLTEMVHCFPPHSMTAFCMTRTKTQNIRKE